MGLTFDASPEPSDEELLARYAAGEARAARQLTERLLPRAFRIAYRLIGDRAEAEDVAQEAMLRLWRQAPDWQGGRAQVSTWLHRVTVNLCADHYRRRRPAPVAEMPDIADGAPSASARMMAADREAALQAALGLLPDRQRQAVVLRHIEGLTNPEIAEVMEIGVEAVESLTARGKRMLASLLAGRRGELGYDES